MIVNNEKISERVECPAEARIHAKSLTFVVVLNETAELHVRGKVYVNAAGKNFLRKIALR